MKCTVLSAFGLMFCVAVGCSREKKGTEVSPQAAIARNASKSIPSFDNESQFASMRRTPIFTVEFDPVGGWQPRTRLNFSASQFAESLRSRNRDLLRSQLLMVESGHSIRDQLQDASQRLEEEDKLFAMESIFQQACVYVETKHFEYALDALAATVMLGFCDRRRVEQKFVASEFQADTRFASILESIDSTKEKGIEFLVRLALEGFAPFAVELPPMVSNDNAQFDMQKSPLHFFFCMGMAYEPCIEMIPLIEEIRLAWKDAPIEFSGILFETQARRRDLVAIKKFVDSKSLRFPVYVADPEHFLAFRGLVAFPSVIVVDQEGFVKAAINHHQSFEVLNEILKAVTKEKSSS